MNNNSINWSQLLQQLQTYQGIYEIHLTIDLPLGDTEALEKFKNHCAELNTKAVIIQLSNGTMPTQPMLSEILQVSPELALQRIQYLAQVLQKHYSLVRVKVEAGLQNTHIPQTTELMTNLDKSCYFEHHIKLLLPSTIDLNQLRLNLAHYQGYLSRNAYTKAPEKQGFEYRFVTQRYWQGNQEAEEQLNKLLDYLKQQAIAAIKVIREFNIFDSHIAVDQGWMQ